MKISKPSPSMIVACVALFVAGGGTAIAASRYVITSTSQIEPSVLSALTAPSRGLDVEVNGPEVSVKAGAGGSARAECPTGDHLVTGGYTADLSPGASIFLNAPDGPSAWLLLIDNHAGAQASTARARVLCAPGRVPLPVGHVNQPPQS